jgi:hypothetical protein
MERSRTTAPWLDPHAKRGYEYKNIRDWNRDSCTSTILSGWDGPSAPFESAWLSEDVMRPGTLILPDQV